MTSIGEKPGIKDLLDALDRVLNSNTFLIECPVDLTVSEPAPALTELIRSARFKDLMIAADSERGWHNYGVWDWEKGQYENLHHAGGFHRPTFDLTLSGLDLDGVHRRLVELLAHTFSPYGKSETEDEAEALVDSFMGELADDGDAPWQYLQIEPDFLHTTGYFGAPTRSEDSDDFAYFDGGAGDSCTVFYRPGQTLMLLTNGSP